MKQIILQASILLILGVVGSVISWGVADKRPDVTKCDPSAIAGGEVCLQTVVEDWKDQAVVWIDARARKDWEEEKVEGALLLNLDPAEDYQELLATAMGQMAFADHVVIYCAKTGCQSSREIFKKLKEGGILNGNEELGTPTVDIRILHGGVQALEAANWMRDSD